MNRSCQTRLHELPRFTQTDLKDDPALRRLFSECGREQLFELAEDAHALTPTAQAITPFAAELEPYVGVVPLKPEIRISGEFRSRGIFPERRRPVSSMLR